MLRVAAFSLTGERYDQSTYLGRFMKMLNICDPSSLIYPTSDIKKAVENLEKYRKLGSDAGFSDTELWRFRKLKESAVHPDTGEIIPLPFRMAGYVPFNGPVCVGLVVSQRTSSILFWQWLNQSQNALVNYFYRSGSGMVTDSILLASYTGAVASAMAIAYVLSKTVKTIIPASIAPTLLRFIALPTSCIASSVNCLVMRWPETSSGISVFSEDGTEVGKSKSAAFKAIKETVASRIFLQFPVYLIPAGFTLLPAIKRILQRNPRLGTPLTTAVMLVSFGIGLPASIAAFPQVGEIGESGLEPEFKGRGTLTYNKGL
jgi:sideroflexin-5